MGIFTTLGKRTEEVKQMFTSDPGYGCFECETRLDEETDTCPSCGSDDVRAIE